MENKDRLLKIKELEKKIDLINREIDSINNEYIKTHTTFKKGDEVEYISSHYESDSNINVLDYYQGNVMKLFVFRDGKIYAKISIDFNDEIPVEELNLFNKDDYKMRDKVNGIPKLNIGDLFYLMVDKPKSTKLKKYKVYQKIESEDSIKYWYYNDNGKPAVVYPGGYRTEL